MIPMLSRFVRNAIAHPKTSAMGLAAIATTINTLIHHPAELGDPQTYAGVLLGLGLLYASDGKTS